jgi:hypothetical protein
MQQILWMLIDYNTNKKYYGFMLNTREPIMSKEARQPPTSVRLQQEVREWLAQRAKKGDRSVNAEINRILKQVMRGEAVREQ